MAITLATVFLIAALLSFLAAAFKRPVWSGSFRDLGFAFVVAAFVIGGAVAIQ